MKNVLKGHGFSRAVESLEDAALASEGLSALTHCCLLHSMIQCSQLPSCGSGNIPSGAEAHFDGTMYGAAEAAPLQNNPSAKFLDRFHKIAPPCCECKEDDSGDHGYEPAKLLVLCCAVLDVDECAAVCRECNGEQAVVAVRVGRLFDTVYVCLPTVEGS